MKKLAATLLVGSLFACASVGHNERLLTVTTSVLERMEAEADIHMERELSKARVSGDIRLEKQLLIFWGTVLTSLDIANLHLSLAVEANRDGQKDLLQKHLFCLKKSATDAVMYMATHRTPFSKGLVLEVAKTYQGKDEYSCQY